MSESNAAEPPNRRDLDSAIRAHFAATTGTPTSFDAAWSQALAQTDHPTQSTGGSRLALAAAALVVMTLTLVYLNTGDPTPPPPQLAELQAQQALFHELVASTRWHAPSDTLLDASLDLQVWGLPTINLPTNLINEELL